MSLLTSINNSFGNLGDVGDFGAVGTDAVPPVDSRYHASHFPCHSSHWEVPPIHPHHSHSIPHILSCHPQRLQQGSRKHQNAQMDQVCFATN